MWLLWEKFGKIGLLFIPTSGHTVGGVLEKFSCDESSSKMYLLTKLNQFATEQNKQLFPALQQRWWWFYRGKESFAFLWTYALKGHSHNALALDRLLYWGKLENFQHKSVVDVKKLFSRNSGKYRFSPRHQ